MAQYAVIGLGRFGMTVARILSENGMDVIAIDKNQELVNEISNRLRRLFVWIPPRRLDPQSQPQRDRRILGISRTFGEHPDRSIAEKIGVGLSCQS